MPRKPPVHLFGSLLSCFLRSQKGWQQPLSNNTRGNIFRDFHCNSFVRNDRCCYAQLGWTSLHTGVLPQEHGTAVKSIEHHSLDGAAAVPASVETTPSVCEQLQSLGVPSVIKEVLKDGLNSVEEAERFQVRSWELSTAEAVGSADERPSDDSDSSSGSSDKLRAPRGTNPRCLPCDHEGCRVKAANYGVPGQNGTRCKRHRLPGMTIVRQGCKAPGCETQATYNYPDSRNYVRCFAHKLPGMVRKNCPVCLDPECTAPATYGPKGDASPSFCANHKTGSMISIHPYPGQRCHEHGCMSEGIYGHRSDRRKKFCSKHKEPGMATLRHALCEEDRCQKHASFGWPGQRVWLMCVDHKKEGMVPKQSCTFEGCYEFPGYGFPGSKMSRCEAHKEPGMKSFKHRRCDVPDCERNAYYGLRGQPALRCPEHKGEGMVRVVNPLCEARGCDRVANFGVPGKPRTHCGRHKDDNMTRYRRMLCGSPDCEENAYYGIPGKAASRCRKHKAEGMVRVTRKLCRVEGCNQVAAYGIQGQSRTHCGLHKEDNMSLRAK